MEQIAAEARAEDSPLDGIKRRIDGKGIVIFTLESGGTIRDPPKYQTLPRSHVSTAKH